MSRGGTSVANDLMEAPGAARQGPTDAGKEGQKRHNVRTDVVRCQPAGGMLVRWRQEVQGASQLRDQELVWCD